MDYPLDDFWSDYELITNGSGKFARALTGVRSSRF